MISVLTPVATVALGGLLVTSGLAGDNISENARKLHFSSIVVDTHDDTTQLMLDTKFDLGARQPKGSIDIPRMREGGLGAIFFSIWIPSKVTGPTAVQKALQQIDAVREQVREHPKDLVLATSAEQIRKAHKNGKIAALMGVEGGHMINSDLGVLRKYAALGVRYMTLTHSGNDEWADSSTDKAVHGGLTDFGKNVVREMNRLGVMEINYHVGFLSQEFRNAEKADPKINEAIAEEVAKRCGSDGNEGCMLIEGDRITREYVAKGVLPRVEYTKIIEHIDHAVRVAGIDHVGLGSDFDGANMPYGMEDASMLPKITEALLKNGYSDSDVKKILGENTLRLMTDVERVSRELNANK